MTQNVGEIEYVIKADTKDLLRAGKASSDLGKTLIRSADDASRASKLMEALGNEVAILEEKEKKGARAAAILSAELKAGANATAAQRREIASLTGQLYDMKTAQDQASNSQSRLKTGLTAIASTIAVSRLVAYGKQFLEVADAMTQLQARIDRLSPSAAEGKKTFQELAAIASESGASLSDTEKLWESLTSSLQSAGASNGQIIQLTSTLQKIGSIGGSSTQEMANALRQFGQSIASGTVRAQEFNSIVEQMPELARQMAAGMGISMDELRKRMLDGKLTAEDALNAIMRQANKVDDQFARLPRSVGQATNSLEVSFQTLVGEINDTTHASTTMVAVIDSITAAIDRLAGRAPNAAQQIAELRSEAEMYARRARTWGWLGFGDWQKENEEQSAKLTADAWEKASRAGYEAAKKVEKNAAPIKIATTTDKDGGKPKGGKSSSSGVDAATQALTRQQAALDRLNTGYADGSLELAKYDAVMALGGKATAQQVAQAEQQAEAIWKVQQATKQVAEEEKKRAQAQQANKAAQQLIAETQSTSYNGGLAQDALAAINLQELQRLEVYRKYREQNLIDQQTYEDTMTAIAYDAAQKRIEALRNQNDAISSSWSELAGSASELAGSLAGAFESSTGKMGSAYAAMFALSKGFAVAQASIGMYTAASQAMTLPFPENLAAAAKALSFGSQIVSAVSGINYSGARYNGGPVSGNSMYRVGEKGKPEIFQASNGNQYMIPGDNGRVISNREMQGGGGGVTSLSQTMNLTINTNGGIDQQTIQQLRQTWQSDTIKLLRDQQRPGGMLSR